MKRHKSVAYFTAVALLNADLLFPPAALPPLVQGETQKDTLGSLLDGLWRSSLSTRFVFWVICSVGSFLFWRWCHCKWSDCNHQQDRGDNYRTWWWWPFGCHCVAIGWGLRVWAKWTLRDLFSYEITLPGTLITHGPYRFLIHPGYAGIMLHILGLLVLFFDVKDKKAMIKVLSIFAIAIACCCVRILEEEAMLQVHFGEEWQIHIESRWHLCPGLW